MKPSKGMFTIKPKIIRNIEIGAGNRASRYCTLENISTKYCRA